MVDVPALRQRRDQRSFESWDEFVPAELVAQSEEAVRQLIDRLLALSPYSAEEQVQAEIDGCVRRFNELDASREDSWIMTIEREDIGEVVLGLVELCGFADSQEWLRERDW